MLFYSLPKRSQLDVGGSLQGEILRTQRHLKQCSFPQIPGGILPSPMAGSQEKIPQIIPSQAHPGRLWSKILPQILPLFPEFPPNASPSAAPRVDTVTPGIFGILCAGGSSGDGICGPSGRSKCSVLSRGGTNSARNFGITESRLCLILTIQLCFQLGQDLLHASNIYRIFVGGEEKILLFQGVFFFLVSCLFPLF